MLRLIQTKFCASSAFRLVVILSVVALGIESAVAAPGDLDPTCDGDGFAYTPIGSASDANGLAIQSDGKLVLAGHAAVGVGAFPVDWAVARYIAADCSLDSTFDGDGIVTTEISPTIDEGAVAVAVQTDGKIVGVGSGDANAAVVRYLPGGALDPTFGSGGIVEIDEYPNPEIALAVAIQGDGKIVTAGSGGPAWVLMRFLTNGALDSSFGGDGIVETAMDTGEAAALRILGDGKIVAVGHANTGSGDGDFGIVRYEDDGDLDLTFGGGDGIVTTDFGGSSEAAKTLVILPDGKLLVSGRSIQAGTSYDYLVARYLSDGSGLDTTFGQGSGFVLTDIVSADVAEGMVRQGDGKIIVGGDAGSNWALVRYLPDGDLDLTFGSDCSGKVVTAALSGGSVRQLELDPSGKLLASGHTSGGSGTQFTLARYMTGPAPACGNGVLECTEECDDGNTADGDGCSGACRIEGFCEDNLTCSPPCDEDADCAPSCGLCIRCGDGRVDTGEACDDGNGVCGDGCDPNCTVPDCGNGYSCSATGEICDDGNTDPGDGCSATCTCEGTCGDGSPNLVEGCEECDADGANCPLGTCCESGCAADCTQVSRCTGTFDCCVTVADCPAGEGCCGDGVTSPGEECDDGNAVRGDGCNELCQRECAQPLPRATPAPVSSTELKCQQTINKETSKFAKAKAKALQKCAEAIIKDKTTSDPGPGGRVNFCLTNQVDGVALKTQVKIDKAASKIGAKIAKVCGGDDRTCGTFDPDEATPDAIGFLGTCPGFEGRGSCTGGTNNRAICTADSDCTGGGTCATCDGPIADCDGLATCVTCIGEAALDQAIVLYYDSLDGLLTGDLQKCQTTIGKEATKYLQQKEQNLRKCWDKGLKGKHNDRCPDFAAPVDSAAHKAAEKIARAESKMIGKICRKCGGSDNDCDDEVRVVNPLTPPFPGSNGGDDPAPSAIGFPTTCDAVTVPGGPACGFGVNTLSDLVSCIACVTEFKVDCIDAARMPELQGRVYPCECSGP